MKRKILKDFKMTEISCVDKPAQPSALATIMKSTSAPTNPVVDQLAQSVLSDAIVKGEINQTDFSSMFKEKMVTRQLDQQLWPALTTLETTIFAIVGSDEIDATAKKSSIAQSLADFSNTVVSLTDPVVLKSAGDILTDVAKSFVTINPNKSNEGVAMPTEIEKKLQGEVDTLKAELAKSVTLAKMSDDEKAHMATLSGDDIEKFLGMSDTERAEAVTISKKADESLNVDGNVILKSTVGDAAFMVMKAQQTRLDLQQAEIKKAQDAAQIATLRKRADDEFGALTGTTDEKANLLKFAETMPEDVRKTFDSIMKSAQDTLNKAFGTQGVNGGGADDTVEKQIETLTKNYQAENSVDYMTAYAAVLEQNPSLYEQL